MKTTDEHPASTGTMPRLPREGLPRFAVAGFSALVALALLTVSFTTEAQQAGKVYRIGFLRYLGCQDQLGPTNLREGLRALGYVEGQNLVIECRAAPGQVDRLPNLAAELLHLKVDVLVTEGTPPTQAAKQLTKTIPIVMVYVGDPIASGLVSGLAKPGGNVTGLSVAAPEMIRKNLEFLKEVAPWVRRVSVWMDVTNPGQTLPDDQMDAAATLLAVRPQRVDLRTAADLDGAFTATLRQRAQALIIYPLPVMPSDFPRIAEFAVKNRLPTITLHTPYLSAGLLMLYGPNIPEQYRRAATYVDKILKGAKPADLPIELPTKFDLTLNLRTAKALGITIPPSILLRADQIVE